MDESNKPITREETNKLSNTDRKFIAEACKPREYNKAQIKAGQEVLKKAKEYHSHKSQYADKEISHANKDIAGYICKKMGREAITVIGGFGSGYSLGAGKWRMVNGKWEKRD